MVLDLDVFEECRQLLVECPWVGLGPSSSKLMLCQQLCCVPCDPGWSQTASPHFVHEA